MITESCDASSKNEKPSHNGASFKPGDMGIPLEKDQAFRFYTNKQASLETITESCDTSSEMKSHLTMVSVSNLVIRVFH